MKFIIDNIKDQYVKEFEISRKNVDGFIVDSVNAPLVINDRDDFKTLLRSTMIGESKEEGLMEHFCGNQEHYMGVYIKHNEGVMDLKNCIANKSVYFKNLLDCVVTKELNLFDYTPGILNSIQGNMESDVYFHSVRRTLGNAITGIPLNFELMIQEVGAIPDKTGSGFYPEYILWHTQFNSELGYIQDIDIYKNHVLKVLVHYKRIVDTVKHNYLWKDLPGSPGTYFYSGFPSVEYGSPTYGEVLFIDSDQTELNNVVQPYQTYRLEAGRVNKYSNSVKISNTYSLNEILIDLFSCTGMVLVSDWFGINPDNTNPANDKYDFAALFCKDIKICQSYDIIRENQELDSFGISGVIDSKNFLKNLMLTFNLIIFSDETDIRIEHVTYLTLKGLNVSLTNNYELKPCKLNEDEINSELFFFAQPTSDDIFYQTKIEYGVKDLYSEENEKKYSIDLFITDVFSTINNEDYNKDEFKKLFFLLSTDGDSIINLNTAFTMDSIVKNLHNVLRPTKRGKIRNNEIVFENYSVGITSELRIINSGFLVWQKLKPFNSVVIKEGTFLIDEVTLKDNNELILKIRK